MTNLNKNNSGFSAIEFLLVIVTLTIIGVAGYFVAKHVDMKTVAKTNVVTSKTTEATKPKTANTPLVIPKITYPECTQESSHDTSQISYESGTAQNTQSSILNVCNTKDGVYVADTTNTSITPVQLSTISNFSDITDKNLKSVILNSDAFTVSGCESKGSIPDSDVTLSAYVPENFADVSPTDCTGQGAIGSLLLVDVGGTWKIVNNGYDSTKPIECSTISKYKIPILFVLLGEGNSTCTTSTGSQDLVSGIVGP